jgi:predicted MFS family arabinose efflux permease
VHFLNEAEISQDFVTKEKTMGEVAMAAMWIAAGSMLVMYLKRRRNRKPLP